MKNVLKIKPTLVKNENVNTVTFKMIYPIKKDYKEANYLDILENIVATSSKKYPNRIDFRNKKLEYCIMNLELSNTSIGDTRYLIFTITLPKEGLIDDYDFEESLKFALNVIKEPNFVGEAVNENEFNYEKDYFVERMKDALQGFNAYTGNIIKHIIDPNELMGPQYENDFEMLRNTTKEDLYRFYEKNILNGKYALYVFGNFDEKKMYTLCDKYFKQEDTSDIEYEYNYFNIIPIAPTKFTQEDIPYMQSEINIQYQVEDYKEDEYVYLYMLDQLLSGSECRLLFNELRLKNDLVYHVDNSLRSKNGYFIVYAYISNENLDKVIDKVDEVLYKTLNDKDLLTQSFKKILKSYEIDMIKEKDNEGKKISDTLNHDFRIDTLEEEYELLKKITPEELINFISRIKKTNTIFLRGGKND